MSRGTLFDLIKLVPLKEGNRIVVESRDWNGTDYTVYDDLETAIKEMPKALGKLEYFPKAHLVRFEANIDNIDPVLVYPISADEFKDLETRESIYRDKTAYELARSGKFAELDDTSSGPDPTMRRDERKAE